MHPLWHMVLAIGVVLGATMFVCAYLIWLERKLAAWVQDRVGPNRVGKFGLLQPLADGLKFLLKEDVVPTHVDKALYFLAPSISLFTTFLAFSVVPFGPSSGKPGEFQFVIAPQLDIGILFLFAATSLAVYGIILGGWASNNKYSMLGALRSSAQVISYEIPLGMSLMGVILLTGSLNLEQAIGHQAARGILGWHFWYQPLACLIFFISALAESNRLPFDLPECEQELVGGYHTEYSAMKFAMFFLAEYTHVITISFLVAILFFGGWHFPWIAEAGERVSGRDDRQGAGAAGQGLCDDPVHHADSLDDPPLPLRSADVAGLARVDSHHRVEPGVRDFRQAVRVVRDVAVAGVAGDVRGRHDRLGASGQTARPAAVAAPGGGGTGGRLELFAGLRRTEFDFAGHRPDDMANGLPGKIELLYV